MGGKGRGVFSDFRLGRVCTVISDWQDPSLIISTVPVPHERACWKSPRCEEGKLVSGRRRKSVIYVYTTTRRHKCIGRRFFCGQVEVLEILWHLTSACAFPLTCCGNSKRQPVGKHTHLATQTSNLNKPKHKHDSPSNIAPSDHNHLYVSHDVPAKGKYHCS